MVVFDPEDEEPPHMTISEYRHEEVVEPSLQITWPLPWGPAPQLTPLWPEQQPDLASTANGARRTSEIKQINGMTLLFILLI